MSQSTPTEGLAVRLELDSSFASADPQRRREFPTQAIRPEPGECFARNLAALRRSQPAIAALVEQSDVPDSVTSTEGRDGSLTYVLPGENDRREWLGRSSMPSVSADALYGECSYEGTNVSLPGIMTGVELLVLAGRLPPQCAIFVVEADPLRLRLAMQLHDYSALIDSGRAVFLDARDLAAALRDFFTDHPGYDFPRTLFTGALRAPAKVAELQRRFESAGEAALQAQGAALVGVVERLGRQSYERIPIGCGTGFQPVRARVENPCHTAHSDTRLEGVPAVPRIALVSMDQRLDSLEQGRRLARGLSALGVANTVCLPETPGRCHVVAGLLAIEAIEADLVLSVNVGVERWRALLPEDLPIGAILLGAEAAAKSVIESLAPRDLVFAASIEVEQAALTNGLPPEQCRRFDPALDDALLRVGEGVRFDPATREFDVAIVADVPDDRAEANDVTLASHVSLWNAVLSVAKRYAQGARATRAGARRPRRPAAGHRKCAEDRARWRRVVRRAGAPKRPARRRANCPSLVEYDSSGSAVRICTCARSIWDVLAAAPGCPACWAASNAIPGCA